MPEKISPETRSRMMAGIKGRDTKPERQVRSYLHSSGFRFRLFRKDLPGRPDIVLPKWKAVVLVHGCFWHAHPSCAFFRIPKTRTAFWTEKLARNAQRDAVAVDALLNMGWRVAVVWECALRADSASAMASLQSFIRSDRTYIEIAGPSAAIATAHR